MTNLHDFALRVAEGQDPELAALRLDLDEARACLVMLEYGLTDEMDKRHLRDCWDAITRIRERATRLLSDDLRPALAESVRRAKHGRECACDACAPFGGGK